MICYAQPPDRSSQPDDDGDGVISTTEYFKQALDEIGLQHIEHAREIAHYLREHVGVDALLNTIIAQDQSAEVSELLHAAMGFGRSAEINLELRKDLLAILIDVAAVCTERQMIEPQVRLGRLLHSLVKTSADPDIREMVQKAITERKLLFDPELLQFSPEQFQTELKFSQRNGDYRGFTQEAGALVYVDTMISVGPPGQDTIETRAVFAPDRIQDARFVIGYETAIRSAQNGATVVLFPLKDRRAVSEIHRQAVEIDRLEGASAAQSYLERTASHISNN